MKIKDLPVVDWPQEKLLRYGPDKLNNYELLAIILGSGSKNNNALELAKKILKQLPEAELIAATTGMLIRFPGIGKTKAVRFIAALELGKRLLYHKQSVLILSPKDVWNELVNIRKEKKEYFVIFYLDVRNQIIKKEIVSIGTLNASLVHPREVFESAIKHSAAQILISHNHPSGDQNPSEEDIVLTKRLEKAGEILGIEIIDHVIITTEKFYSLKEHNLL